MNASELQRRLAENLARVRERIAQAAASAGRQPDAIRLIAVTKYAPVEFARALADLGCVDLGESRPQQLAARADQLRGLPIRWHLVGHLQRNKIRLVLPHVHLYHSIDSSRLAAALASEAAAAGISPSVLVEVNISGDVAKHGFSMADVPEAVASIAAEPRLNLRGLMGMSGLESDAAQSLAQFRSLAALRDKLVAGGVSAQRLTELSMGMSDDFEQAILAGATIVRLGSVLFEGVEV